MAFVACAKQVVAHTAFRECLDRMWFGRLVRDLPRECMFSTNLFRGTLDQSPRSPAYWSNESTEHFRAISYATVLDSAAVDFFFNWQLFVTTQCATDCKFKKKLATKLLRLKTFKIKCDSKAVVIFQN